MTRITVELPEDVFSSPRRSPEEFARELRVAAAVHWYEQGEVSHEKAAVIAGMSRTQFMDELARQKLPAFAVDIEGIKRELARD